LTRRGYYIDEDVYWHDSTQPCEQRARVLDVSGHWVLLRLESGTHRGRQTWVHSLEVKHLDFSLESPHIQRLQDRRLEACRYVQLARPEVVGVCEVCFGALTPLQQQGQPVSAWLYCPSCDRTQRRSAAA
jgi:hypothetical protein